MTEFDSDALSRLAADLDELGWPSPETLTRYASEPDSLSAEGRAAIEAVLASDPAMRDEIETLRGFDFQALVAPVNAPLNVPPNAPRDAREGAGLNETGASVIDARGRFGGASGRRWGWAFAAALAGLAFWWISGSLTGEDTVPSMAEARPTPSTHGPVRVPVRDDDADAAPARPDARPRTESLAGNEDGMRPTAELARPSKPNRTIDPDPGLPPDARPARRTPERAPAPPPTKAAPSPKPELLLAMAMPHYRPAFGLDRPDRLDAIVRGADETAAEIQIVSPDHVTRVVSKAPVLPWRTGTLPAGGHFVLTILTEDDAIVAVDVPLERPTMAGQQRVDLSALGIALPHAQLLRWSVAWRPEADAPPAAFDFGWMRFIPLSAGEESAFDALPAPQRPGYLAERGAFYEALAAAESIAAAHPAAAAPRAAVDRLLEEVPAAAR